ncbi:hypothetical protein [uncultured Sulfitobacter sp.]|uniref:hypothetical protein n=1 Tax=uncultured Sulfitobacter sp. TaxID=191468 RepID=UPI0026376128|nr:hypothetical protein [uncultured Sulfitobacter sp.]
MIDKDGDSIGTATLHQGANGVLIYVRVEGLAPGNPACTRIASRRAIPRQISRRPKDMSARSMAATA